MALTEERKKYWRAVDELEEKKYEKVQRAIEKKELKKLDRWIRQFAGGKEDWLS